MQLSQNFSLAEAQVTNTGLRNSIPKELIGKAVFTASRMEAVRKLLGNRPVRVNSWYRGPDVNKKVGGVPSSQHTQAEAVDFICPSYGTAYEVALLLKDKVGELNFDQLIYEQTWVHISFVNHTTPRNQLLTMKAGKYTNGINK